MPSRSNKGSPNLRCRVLLVDDNADLVHLYSRLLSRDQTLEVVTATSGSKAFDLAATDWFSNVVIDAKLNYRGHQYGGLTLAEDLRRRYGASALLVMSQYISSAELAERRVSCDFISKSLTGETDSFVKSLSQRIREHRKHQYGFVAMPYSPEMTERYEQFVAPAIRAAGFECKRADEFVHNRLIVSEMLRRIQESKFVVLLADGDNANAFYEAGFAEAMSKEIFIVARSASDLRTDLRGRSIIAHEEDWTGAQRELQRRINLLELGSRQ